MKKCTTCGEEKELNKFRIVKKKYVRGECKECESITSKKKYDRNYKIIIEGKSGGCVLCGENRHHCALDYHHKDPSLKNKEFKSKSTWGEKTLREELDKCVVLCATCHRLVHEGILEI